MTAASRLVYVRYEMLRVLRNRRIVILSLTFPVVLYLVIAGPSRDVSDFADTGISAPLYFMVGLAAYGTMTPMLGSGGRIAADRAAGWNRQLRVSPLPSSVYLGAKVLTGYLLAAMSIAVIFVCGIALGVRLPADRWLAMTGLLLVGLVPFAALGIALGHLFGADSIGPAIGVGVAVLSLLGGSWFPVNGHGFLHAVGQVLPSYWLVRASHVGLGAPAWGLKGWLLMTAWTVGLTVLAARVYRNDTGRTG